MELRWATIFNSVCVLNQRWTLCDKHTRSAFKMLSHLYKYANMVKFVSFFNNIEIRMHARANTQRQCSISKSTNPMTFCIQLQLFSNRMYILRLSIIKRFDWIAGYLLIKLAGVYWSHISETRTWSTWMIRPESNCLLPNWNGKHKFSTRFCFFVRLLLK